MQWAVIRESLTSLPKGQSISYSSYTLTDIYFTDINIKNTVKN